MGDLAKTAVPLALNLGDDGLYLGLPTVADLPARAKTLTQRRGGRLGRSDLPQ